MEEMGLGVPPGMRDDVWVSRTHSRGDGERGGHSQLFSVAPDVIWCHARKFRKGTPQLMPRGKMKLQLVESSCMSVHPLATRLWHSILAPPEGRARLPAPPLRLSASQRRFPRNHHCASTRHGGCSQRWRVQLKFWCLDHRSRCQKPPVGCHVKSLARHAQH